MEVVRRVVRSHLAEVRYCYETALLGAPDLAGRVAVRFVIASSGAVDEAGVVTSTVGRVALDRCIERAVRRWAFPPPDDGLPVVVSYPFVLELAGTP
jgi:TonB family protein